MIPKRDLARFLQKARAANDGQGALFPDGAAERVSAAKADYNTFVRTYFSHYAENDCASFHLDFAAELSRRKHVTILFEAFRGAAKSTHASLIAPLWLMIRGELRFMVLVGQTADKAKVLLSDIKSELETNELFIKDFGRQQSIDQWTDDTLRTQQGVMFKCIGFGQDPAGLRNKQFRPDYIVCDDLESADLCRNERRVREGVEWLMQRLYGCFGVKYRRFVLANNRTHPKGLVWLLEKEMKAKGIFYPLKINALDANGRSTWADRFPDDLLREIRENTTPRAWAANYMNTPYIDGSLFKDNMISFAQSLPPSEYDAIVGYADLSYKADGDYKAFALVGAKGGEFHVLKIFCRQTDTSVFAEWLHELEREMSDAGAYPVYYYEANATQQIVNEPIFADVAAKLGDYVRIIPDRRVKGDKHARVEATLYPLFCRNKVLFCSTLKDTPDAISAIDQMLAFEKGSKSHDDFPDALEGAVFLLTKQARRGDPNGYIAGTDSHTTAYSF